MLSMLAALSCVFGGCDAPAEPAQGVWLIRIELGEAECEGRLDLRPGPDGGVAGTLYLCEGQFGKVTGEQRSNELVLDFEPQNYAGPHLTVRASLDGNYLLGAFDYGVVEGWRGAPPSRPAAPRDADNDDQDEFETV